MVASNIRGTWSKSSFQQTFKEYLFTVFCIEKAIVKKKRLGIAHFLIKKFTQDHLWKCFVLCKLFFAAIIYYFYWVLNFSYLFVSSVIKFIYDKRSAVLWCWACSCGSFNTRRMWKNCQTSLPRYCSAKYQIVLTISDMLKM